MAIRDCDYVSVEGKAFSWLLTISIEDVQSLELGAAAFLLDPTAANVGEHGPGMMVGTNNFFKNQFPKEMLAGIANCIKIYQLYFCYANVMLFGRLYI